MRLVDADSAAAYLRETGHLESDETVRVTELTGGVSNVVLLVQRSANRPNFVVKQAREQLRVAEPWFCSVERIWREVQVLRICEHVLLGGGQNAETQNAETQNAATAGAAPPDHDAAAIRATVPRLLFTDDRNYLFAMSAAPPHQVWKQHLLAGQADPAIALACGDLLGRMHANTWCDQRIARDLGDRKFFDDLRIDPYYRHVAAGHAPLRAPLERLIDSVPENCLALVHGDFSPKNLLVSGSQLMLVDFEVGHFGDPAFDLGFFLSHLVLKSLRARSDDRPATASSLLELTVQFWATYRQRMMDRLAGDQYDQLVRRAIQHFAGCALARVDGKSPVDYLQAETRNVVRRIMAQLLTSDAATWDQVLAHVR